MQFAVLIRSSAPPTPILQNKRMIDSSQKEKIAVLHVSADEGVWVECAEQFQQKLRYIVGVTIFKFAIFGVC